MSDEQASWQDRDTPASRRVMAHIRLIDAALSSQLRVIFRAPEFRKLEAAWRGLHYLVSNAEADSHSEGAGVISIRVLNVSKQDLARDLERVTDFDQSEIFRKTYTEQFDTPGGEPYCVLIGDYEFTNHPEDIDLLTRISGVAAAGFCPFISAAAPNLLGMDSFADLSTPRDLGKLFLGPDYAKWRSFRDSEDSRFIVLTLPRVLSRLPHTENERVAGRPQPFPTERPSASAAVQTPDGGDSSLVGEFAFEECERNVTGPPVPIRQEHHAWMNTAFVYGTCLTRAFALFGWCEAIRGMVGGGLIKGLPASCFVADDGMPELACPTDIGIGDRLGSDLGRLGFMPLCHPKGADYAVFFSSDSVHRPRQYRSEAAAEDAAMNARLPVIFAASRIAHYLKAIARDKPGGLPDARQWTEYLDRWIQQWVWKEQRSPAERAPLLPFSGARVEVREIAGFPGRFQVEAHFGLQALRGLSWRGCRLVTRLPDPARL